MKTRALPFVAGGLVLLLLLAAPGFATAFGEPVDSRPDTTFRYQGRTARITQLDHLPFVQNEYTRPFKFDSADNPKLKELRDRWQLDQVVAAGQDEFDRQVLLMDWVHHRFQKFGQPSITTRGALDILEGIEQGETFFCAQYAQLFTSAAASLGWVDRLLALRRHQGVAARGGSTEHSTTEIWSNQHRKWVMLDPTSNMYLEKGGVPLNAWEIRQEWFYHSGAGLVFVIGKEKRRYTKSDLPIELKQFPGFGALTVEPDELDKYGFIGYIPNTDLMDSGLDYGRMVIAKDALCEGTQWHRRVQPENPAVDLYFPVGQAEINLRSEQGKLTVHLKTFTPNFERFEIRPAGGYWRATDAKFEWPLEPGTNQLEARAINRFGVPGAVSRIAVELQ